MEFLQFPEFSKELKKLKKKYKTIDDDLRKFQKVLRVRPMGDGTKHWNVISKTETVVIFKARLSCAYLKRTSLRIIYACNKQNEKIVSVTFLEIYFKGNKTNEDRVRVEEYLKHVT